jgi:hypothetical protein
VNYDAEAQLKFGSPEMRPDFSAAKDSVPRAELLLRFKVGSNDAEADDESGSNELADLEESEKEARLLALRFRELKIHITKSGTTGQKYSAPSSGATWRFCCARRRAKRRFLRNNSSVPEFRL